MKMTSSLKQHIAHNNEGFVIEAVTGLRVQDGVYHVRVQWEGGAETYEPLDHIRQDAPIAMNAYVTELRSKNDPGNQQVVQYYDDLRRRTKRNR